MSTASTLFLTGILVAVISVTASAFAKRPGDIWSYYHFDGRAFVSGKPLDGGLFVAMGEQIMPVVASGKAKIETVVQSVGKGSIVGICYVQRSGGKLSGGAGFTPAPNTTVRIAGSMGNALISSDGYGYFIAELEAGEYEITAGSAKTQVSVVEGKTTLTALRTGKRLVD